MITTSGKDDSPVAAKDSTPADLKDSSPVSAKDSAPAVDPSIHPVLGVDYRSAGAVRRMLNERANAVAYEAIDRVKRIDRDLKEIGFTGDPEKLADASADNKLPVGRTSGKSDVTAPVVTTPVTTTTSATSPPATSPGTTSGTGPSTTGTSPSTTASTSASAR